MVKTAAPRHRLNPGSVRADSKETKTCDKRRFQGRPSAIGIISSRSIKSVSVANLVREVRGNGESNRRYPRRLIMGSSIWRTPADIILSRRLQSPPRRRASAKLFRSRGGKGRRLEGSGAAKSEINEAKPSL